MKKYWVGKHFNVALAYGDVTGLTDEDEKALDQFLSRLPGHYPEFDHSEETEFRTCAITGLNSDCVLVVFRSNNT